MPEIKLNSLTKRYGNLIAVNNINLEFSEPGCVGILGPNGAGKTTLMKLMTNISRPNGGKVEINGIDVSNEPRRALIGVGSLVEQPEFYTYISGLETLKFVCRVKGKSPKECEEEIERVIKITEMGSYIHRKAGQFSRGMKQRLALAVALLCDPEILILDEPTFGLDPKGMKDIRELIRKITSNGDKLVILSTHLIYEVKELCNRVVIMNLGKNVYDSKFEDNGKWLRVNLSGKMPAVKFDSSRVVDYRTKGNDLIIKKSPSVENYEILDDLFRMGLKINSASDYDDLEDIYVSIVGKSPTLEQ